MVGVIIMNMTKGQILRELKEKCSGINVLPVYIVKKANFNMNKTETVKEIVSFFLARGGLIDL